MIDPELAPAVMMNSRDPKNRASNKHLDLILGRWEHEVTAITGAIDSIVDPKVFMDLTRQFKRLHSSFISCLYYVISHRTSCRNLLFGGGGFKLFLSFWCLRLCHCTQQLNCYTSLRSQNKHYSKFKLISFFGHLKFLYSLIKL